jgi:hypothetical protein
MPNGLGGERLWLCPTINNSTDDISGNGNSGTFNGMSINNDADGKHYYQGSSDSDSLAGTFSTPFAVRSISFWVSSSSTGSSSFHMLNSVSSSNKLSDSRWSKRYRVVVDGVTGNYATTFINKDVWHQVVITYNPNSQTSSVYINGVLDGQTTGVTGTTITDSYEIGAVQMFSRYDDLRAYDRVLTQAEITHLSSKRGVLGSPPKGLGDEQLWLCPSLQDSVNDLSNSNNHGTYIGGMTTIPDTSNGGSLCYDFDGTDDYIDCGNILNFTGPFSVSYWVLNNTTTKALYISKNWNGTSEGYISRFDGGTNGPLQFYTYQGNILGTSVQNPFTVSQWSCVTNVYTGTHWEIYFDGVRIAQTAQTQSPFSNTGNLFIGASSVGGWNFDGRMDDIRFFERAITQAEITHLASQRGVQGHPTIKGLGDEKLWLCPSLNDSAGDISGNGNDGTLNGGMSVVTDVDLTYGGAKAFEFDGIDDHISLPNVAIIQGTTSQFSTSTWVKMDSAAASDPSWPYTTKYSFGYNRRYPSFPTKGYESFFLYYGSLFYIDLRLTNWTNTYGLWNRYTLSTSPNNTWLNICVTYDGSLSPSGLKLFVDGTELSHTSYRNSLSSTSLVSQGPPFIGKGGDPNKFSFGLQDDLRVYDRALNQEEIAHLAKSRAVSGGPYNLNGIKHLLSSFIHPLG